MNILWIILIIIGVLAILFLFAVKPRNQAIHDWKPHQEVLYAHRGLHDKKKNIPENSMAAFRRAVDAGYGIELDVQLTKDRIPVVFHDFTLERMTGQPGKVYEYTLEELREFRLDGTDEQIPTFEEFLNMVDGRVPLIVEYKVEWMDFSVCPIGDALLKNYKGLYIIESFNPLALSWYRKNRNEIIRGQLSDRFRRKDGYKGALYFFLKHLMLNWMTRPDFIAYNHENCSDPGFLTATKFFKAKPVAWTIKSQAELDKAKEHFDIFIFEQFIPNNRSIVYLDKKK
ncbi:MAG: glycerophosphodiester phosphodiesterase [Lachnospiraceae bacterium]|nr:glycerophosphodiester phosphodiesterase [Lachnospiraceae bacterium]